MSEESGWQKRSSVTQLGVAQGSATITPSPVPGEPLAAIALEPGTRIAQYELIRELGHGGMGVVFVARDVRLGRRVAIKFLRDASREIADRFLVEARATARCQHDNIVIVYEVDELLGIPYMVLELVEGKTLREVMDELGHGFEMPASRVIELALPIARALARAHELAIVHRDLKPENVIVTDAGQVKVLDFGIAKALGRDHVEAPDAAATRTWPATVHPLHTGEGVAVGTLPYMAPEQFGNTGVDHRADLWALGIIVFELLAGRHPVDTLSRDALIANLLATTPMPSIRHAVPGVPEALGELVDGCLQRDKHARPVAAADVVVALEALLPRRAVARDDDGPFPGLTAFQESDAGRFFGRGRDIARMVARVREQPMTAVIGPSGAGKSSFVRAGVGPALKASGERWDVIALRPGRAPLSALAAVAARTTGNATAPELDAWVDRMRAEPGALGVALRARAATAGGNIVLFVDQLEELYTLVADRDDRLAFTAALAGVADDVAAPLRVVVAMRSDFLDRAAEDARFLDGLSRGVVVLSTPDRDGMRAALTEPLDQVGYRFETPAIAELMLDALADTPGPLPLLQFCAGVLWDARDRDRRLITAASYRAIGGITGALAAHADNVIAGMSASSQRLARRVFRRLVTPDRTREVVELADIVELGGGDQLDRVIDQLVAARLVVIQSRVDAGGGSLEIAHESLIDRWPQLRRWLDEDHEDAVFLAQLAAAAKQWDGRGRPSGLLWRGVALDDAHRWYTSGPRELAPREQAFLDAALALARRGRRLRRAAAIGAFAILAAVAGGASVALWRVSAAEQRATDNLDTANAEAARARAALAAEQHEQAQRLAAESRRDEAVELAALARSRAEQSEDAERMTADELAAANAELAAAARAADAARDRAERATEKATAAAAEARRLNAELEKALASARARVKALEQEKLSKQLKD